MSEPEITRFRELIERSSLGTPAARRIRARAPREQVEEVLRQVREMDDAGHDPDPEENR